MNDDAEIQAMVRVNEALANLDEDVAKRVIQWATARYIKNLPASFDANLKADSVLPSIETSKAEMIFEDVASLFDAANPDTEAEKVLVVAYWFQVNQAQSDVDAFSINAELKNLGHGVANITRALDNLINRKPRLVIQTRKSGTSQQARKKFKVTIEGIRKVRAMLAGVDDAE